MINFSEDELNKILKITKQPENKLNRTALEKILKKDLKMKTVYKLTLICSNSKLSDVWREILLKIFK